LAEKLGDGNLKSQGRREGAEEQGILKEESLRELVPEITLSNVIEQLSRRR